MGPFLPGNVCNAAKSDCATLLPLLMTSLWSMLLCVCASVCVMSMSECRLFVMVSVCVCEREGGVSGGDREDSRW